MAMRVRHFDLWSQSFSGNSQNSQKYLPQEFQNVKNPFCT
uniref:Uncharacterized protein n=1 Tax=Anguilla anguilla TaxID=7936 RepID=A0A0E9PE83_ANGAN